jgi:type III pantothenate kinase
MGNSSLKWATVSEGVLSETGLLTYDDLESQLTSQWQLLAAPEAIMVSCVAHEQKWAIVSRCAQALWNLIPRRIVSSGKEHGVVNAYRQPETLGSDRWMALVAAHELYDRGVCIVDCGTALTIDLLNADGQHLGGVIVPGAHMMQSSLHINTATLPESALNQSAISNDQYWGQDTQSGIITGSWLAQAGAVQQVYQQYARQSDKPVCVLCGGGASILAGYVQKAIGRKPELEPDLVIKGLAVIVGENIKS